LPARYAAPNASVGAAGSTITTSDPLGKRAPDTRAAVSAAVAPASRPSAGGGAVLGTLAWLPPPPPHAASTIATPVTTRARLHPPPHRGVTGGGGSGGPEWRGRG